MRISDYSMVNVGTADEDCEIKQIRFGRGDLRKAIIKTVTADEIVIQLTGYRKGDLIHIHPADDHFEYSTIEGGKA